VTIKTIEATMEKAYPNPPCQDAYNSFLLLLAKGKGSLKRSVQAN
jgi:hypothetical protein